jgi:hypothetical protein
MTDYVTMKPTFRYSSWGISGELPGSRSDSDPTVGLRLDPQQAQRFLGRVRQCVVEPP